MRSSLDILGSSQFFVYLSHDFLLPAFDRLSDARFDTITGASVGGFVAKRRGGGLQVSSTDRELQALRRMIRLAREWGRVENALPACWASSISQEDPVARPE
jgi:hypothetical protein